MTTTLSKRGVTVALVAALSATTLAGTPALAAPFDQPHAQKERVVKGTSVKSSGVEMPRTGKPVKRAAAAWPTAKVVEVDPGAVTTSRTPESRGPVRVLPSGKPGQKVRIETYDRAKSKAAGVNGFVFRVSGGEAKVSVDYSPFRSAYGGGWAARLRLVELPECALSTPDKVECAGKVVPSINDVAKGTVTASVPISSRGALMGVTSGASSSAGTYAATSLSPSGTWSDGGNSGGFNWSYEMRTPPGLNGPTPNLTLRYSSASVDGMMPASNNQPSWVGQGFSLGTSYIERRYRTCSDDMADGARNTEKTSDQCWATDNASLSMDDRAGELIKDPMVENRWHLRSDDGTYVERKVGGGINNGARNNEHWVVTTTDGTQYWFGRSGQSTLTVPVAGNHVGEPCAANAFKDSFCDQAYRWNLEYVVDLHGNTMTYTYEKETNHYGRNKTRTDIARYDRASFLKQIDYGTRNDRSETAPMQIVFETADRCLSDCGVHDESHWTDVPWDQECVTGSCDIHAPTFWTTKRLASITTKVGGNPVEKWTFSHMFPDPGDGTRAGLWLEKISHEGLVGQATTVPDITFVGEQLNNRVDTSSDQYAAMNWWRVKEILSETGGKISVAYSAQDCAAGSRMPNKAALHDNKLRCYPVRWTPEGHIDPIVDFFHKYVVTRVTESDLTTGGEAVLTEYDYVGDPAWHYTDDDGLIKDEDKTWSVWRGYEKVRTVKGKLSERTLTETRYFRGMHGDESASGTKNVVLPAITVGDIPEANDEDAFAGMPRETITYNGPGGAEVSASVTTPWQSPPTASRTVGDVTVHARHSKAAGEHKRVALDGGRGFQSTSTFTTFDDVYGMPVRTEDRGDDAVTGDEKCELTDYARNTSVWLVGAVSRTRRFVTDCVKAATRPVDADIAGDNLLSFDGQAFGAAPTKGDVTKLETLKSYVNGLPTYLTQAATEYDVYGRITKVIDPKGTTATAYTPAVGGPVTKTTATNALGWTTTTDFQPAWGLPLAVVDSNQQRSEISYDGLGRTSAVWLRKQPNATKAPDKTFEYLVRKNGPVVVTTKTINQDGGYVTAHQLYDGLLRPRQAQGSDAVGGAGAVVTDQYYDSAGREVRKNNPYVADTPPSTNLFVASDLIPSQTALTFDGAGRTIVQALKRNASVGGVGGTVVNSTRTDYAGDRVDVTPPAGGTITSTVVDVLGRTKELRQYHAGAGAGSPDPSTYDATIYTYDRHDRLDTVTTPSGHIWDYDYDLRGRWTRAVDPDKGTTTSTYDDADRIESTTDGRGVTIALTYDTIGRKTSVREGSKAGPKRAEWFYDKLSNGTTTNGVLVKSIRYDGINEYVAENTKFNSSYQPLWSTFKVPDSETRLAGTYKYENTYYANGAPQSTRVPALGDLYKEHLTFKYDALGKPKTVGSTYGTSLTGSLVTATEYTSYGELGAFMLRNENGSVGISRQYEETTRRLSQIVTRREIGPTTVAKVDYGYDDAGNVTRIADSVSGDTQCFRTDHLRRLKDAWTPASGDCVPNPSADALGGPAKYWQSFDYNKAGDRTSLVERGTFPATRSVTYTPVAGKHGLASTLTTDGDGTHTGAYSYDDTGNMLTRPAPSGGTQTMTWDPEGHLATSTDSTGTTSYLYDADGNRMIRRDPAGKTLYLPGQELRVTASGEAKATRYYSYGGQTVAARTYDGLQWMSSDRNGTAEFTIADDGGQTVRARRMMPFGEKRGDTTSWLAFLDKGFVGGTQDNTGLTHLGAREYEPAAGRFISVDPIVDHLDPQQMHGYSYSNNSPVTFTDPSGLSHSCPDNDCRNTAPTGLKGKPVQKNPPKDNGQTTPGSDAPAGWYVPAMKDHGNGYVLGHEYGMAYLNGVKLPWDPVAADQHVRRMKDLFGGDIYGELGSEDNVENTFNVLLAYCQDNCTRDQLNAIKAPWLIFLGETGALADGGRGANAGLARSVGRFIQRTCGRHSFASDTLVLMADGTTKRIDQIKVGDKVTNSNPESEKIEHHAVTAVHVTDEDKEYVDLTIATAEGPQTITTMAHHQFYNTTTRTWVDANVFRPGDQLNTPGNGRTVLLAAKRYVSLLRTYDLSIAIVHTYCVAVGGIAVLVHNSNVCLPVLREWSSQQFRFGNQTFLLDKKGM